MSKHIASGHELLVAEFLKHFEEKMTLQEGKPLTYDQMHGMGMLKPYAARIPLTMIAELEARAHFGPWRSKQEMVYALIRASIDEIARGEETVRELLIEAAQRGLEQWQSEKTDWPRSKKPRARAKK